MYSTSDICVKICVTGSGSAYLLDVHASVVNVTSADGVVSVRRVLTAALTLPSIRTRTQTERRLRVSDAVRPKPCGRRLRGPRRGRRRGHWSRQRHFSSPTHVRAFFFLVFHFLPLRLLQCIMSRFLCVAVGRRYPTALTNSIWELQKMKVCSKPQNDIRCFFSFSGCCDEDWNRPE